MIPTCSRCQQVIPAPDINVMNDVAFCRACNMAHKLSSLVHETSVDAVDFTKPPPGTWYRSSGLGAIVGATHRSLPTALVTLAISLFWNGIVSVFVLLTLSSTLQHFQVPVPDWFPAPKMNGSEMSVGMTLFLWLFLTPFIVVGTVMIGAFLSAVCGRTEVVIGQTEGVVFVGIGSIGWRRRFNPAVVRNVRLQSKQWRDSDGDRQNKMHVVIESEGGNDIEFGSMLRKDRMNFVAASVRDALNGKTF